MKFFRTRGAALALASALAAALLTGCAAAVVGGAVGTGALLMTADRRSAETQDADQAIEAGAREVVAQALAGRGHVNVASYYRKALITGEVPSVQDRQLMETRVRALPGGATLPLVLLSSWWSQRLLARGWTSRSARGRFSSLWLVIAGWPSCRC